MKLEGFFKNQNKFCILLEVIVLLCLITVLTVFQPVYAGILLNVAIPILVMLSLKLVFFEKLKLSTLLVMRILIIFPVLGLMDGNLFIKIQIIFLAINILEATITDFKRKKICNGITGIFLAITVFLLGSKWMGNYFISYATNSNQDILVFATWCWIIAYTIWNWFFIVFEFKPGIAFLHLGILATPIILGFIFGPEIWLIARANSLTFGGGVIQISCKKYFEQYFTSAKWEKYLLIVQQKQFQLTFMILNLTLFTLMYFFR